MVPGVVRVQGLDAVDVHVLPPSEVPPGDRDVHDLCRRWAEAPENGGWVVTDECTVPTRQRGRHRPRQRRLDAADEEDASVHTPQPAQRDAMPDRSPAQADGEKLRPRDDAVLSPRDLHRSPISDHEVTLDGSSEAPCRETVV